MPRKSKHMTGQPFRQNVLLDGHTAAALDAIAPGNLSEALRFCVALALQAGAVEQARALRAQVVARQTPDRSSGVVDKSRGPLAPSVALN
jgi:hypothetical protein